MTVLDIDLDLFLDRRPSHVNPNGRLSDAEFGPWSTSDVEEFMIKQCKLSRTRPIPGGVVTFHHELFDIWKKLIAEGRMPALFDVIHADSHADMGMGDASAGYIMGELLHSDPNSRLNPKRDVIDGLLEGNYLSFAIACRWIRSIVYVHHPSVPNDNGGIHDIPDCLFRNYDPHCGVIELKKLPPECRDGIRRKSEFTPLAFEPAISIRLEECRSFVSESEPSFLFLAQSPNYTPKSSDRLIEVCRQFIDERAFGISAYPISPK